MRASAGLPGPCVARGAEDLGDTPQGKRGCVPLTAEGVTWQLLPSTNLASSCRRARTPTLGDPAAVLAWITRPSDLGKKKVQKKIPAGYPAVGADQTTTSRWVVPRPEGRVIQQIGALTRSSLLYRVR